MRGLAGRCTQLKYVLKAHLSEQLTGAWHEFVEGFRRSKQALHQCVQSWQQVVPEQGYRDTSGKPLPTAAQRPHEND
eukprot:8308083-Prorocentrum_lima.AAC.1